MSDTIVINYGSDLNFTFNWPDGGGGNADLTGYTVALTDLSHAWLSDYVTSEVTDEGVGLITIDLQWHDKMPMGRVMHFRIAISQSGYDITTNRLWIEVR